jgi:nicotinamide mononucleotide transporter
MAAAWFAWLPITPVEVLGFVSGAVGVWLAVKENIWTWPVGIFNAVCWTILFLQARLFADMSLQVVYIVLCSLGWYWWLHGGSHKSALVVWRTPVVQWIVLGSIGALATFGMTLYLTAIKDAAPFLDALTTVLSLVAQYQLTRKYFENWHVWIVADVIYVGLYIYKGLYLTSVLYVVFVVMCVIGLARWRRALARSEAPHGEPVQAQAEHA